MSVSLPIDMPILNSDQAKANIGDDLFNDLLENFEDMTLNEVLENLKNAMDKIDYREIRLMAHKLKAPAGYIGADRLFKMTESLQKCIDSQDADSAYRTYPLMIAECIKLKRVKRKYLSELKSNRHLYAFRCPLRARRHRL
jgi:HPt (histidine-containing phosphotransfer) domain-containing protein